MAATQARRVITYPNGRAPLLGFVQKAGTVIYKNSLAPTVEVEIHVEPFITIRVSFIASTISGGIFAPAICPRWIVITVRNSLHDCPAISRVCPVGSEVTCIFGIGKSLSPAAGVLPDGLPDGLPDVMRCTVFWVGASGKICLLPTAVTVAIRVAGC